MYIGGVPQGFVDTTGSLSTNKSFSGCIGDATFKGSVINFANSTDRRNEILGKCILDKSIGSDSDIHKGIHSLTALIICCNILSNSYFLVPELPPLVEIGEVTEDYTIDRTIDPSEAGKKKGIFNIGLSVIIYFFKKFLNVAMEEAIEVPATLSKSKRQRQLKWIWNKLPKHPL